MKGAITILMLANEQLTASPVRATAAYEALQSLVVRHPGSTRMRHRCAVLALSLSGVIGCSSTAGENWPPFVDRLIAQLEVEPKRNRPGSIWRYNYRGLVVFYVPPYCCDVPSELYDSDGNYICSPDGGIKGDGDGKCADFFDARTEEQRVWFDER